MVDMMNAPEQHPIADDTAIYEATVAQPLSQTACHGLRFVLAASCTRIIVLSRVEPISREGIVAGLPCNNLPLFKWERSVRPGIYYLPLKFQ